MPGVVHLRAGETFTRWFDRDHWGGPSKRRFWHNLPGAPSVQFPSTVSSWPFGNAANPRRPRPATVVIRKLDGGRIGT